MRDAESKELLARGKCSAIHLLKVLFCLFPQSRDRIDVMIGDVEAALAPLLPGNFIVAHDLLERQFKGITDVVKKRCQSPVFKETAGGSVILLRIRVVRVKPVEFLEGRAIRFVGLVDRKSERKHVDGVGIVVAVLHQERTAIGLVFREKFYHFL